MNEWTKKSAIQMLDAATTRRAVMDLASKVYGKVPDPDWKEVWTYASTRHNRLPDDGTPMIDPAGGWVKSASRTGGFPPAWIMQYGADFMVKGESSARRYLASIHKTAFPIIRVTLAEDAPQWEDWKGKVVNLDIHQTGVEPKMATLFSAALEAGGAVAMKKGGQWFGMSQGEQTLKPRDADVAMSVRVWPITEQEAMNLPHLPDHWQTMVRIYDL
ncbi:hypothetical protein ACFL2T_01135 [Elusimicrobiota bacterium]